MGPESGIILQSICDTCGTGHTERLGATLPPDAEARAERARGEPCPTCGALDGKRRVSIRFGSMWRLATVAD